MKLFLSLLILSIGLLPACKSAKNKTNSKVKTEKSLNGTWELNYISAEADLFSFEELYPGKKPTITFDTKANTIYGNTSCNNFNGTLKTDGNKIDFKEPMAMTKMLCQGQGEEKFIQTLAKVTTYSISEDNTLALISGDVAIMRFVLK